MDCNMNRNAANENMAGNMNRNHGCANAGRGMNRNYMGPGMNRGNFNGGNRGMNRGYANGNMNRGCANGNLNRGCANGNLNHNMGNMGDVQNCKKNCDNSEVRDDMNHSCHDGCDRGNQAVDKMKPGMAFVPWQEWKDIYDMEKALECGTIFGELDKPYLGRPVK